jgi:hypothetical protein
MPRLDELLANAETRAELAAQLREQDRIARLGAVYPRFLELRVKIEAGETLDEAEKAEYDGTLDEFPELDGRNVTEERAAEINAKRESGEELSISDGVAADGLLRLAGERRRIEWHRRDRLQPPRGLACPSAAIRGPRGRGHRPTTARHTCRASSRRRGPPRERDEEPDLASAGGAR